MHQNQHGNAFIPADTITGAMLERIRSERLLDDFAYRNADGTPFKGRLVVRDISTELVSPCIWVEPVTGEAPVIRSFNAPGAPFAELTRNGLEFYSIGTTTRVRWTLARSAGAYTRRM